jgi:signal transduction histidine kinase/CheY-like chemotaxis protein/HPt (histidine-containing phosphotransfer) domain-containing protein
MMRLPDLPRGVIPWLACHRAKLWLACSSFVAVCFLCIGVLALLAVRWDARRQASEAAANIAGIVERDITRNVETFDLALKTAMSGLQLPGIWDLSPQVRNLVLFDRAVGIRYLSFINVLDENGDVIADPQQPQHPTNWSNSAYFMAHRRDASLGLFVSRPFQAGNEDYAGISFSRRVSHADGTFAGVAVAAVRLAAIRELFSRLALGAHGSVALLRNDGVVLMRQPFDRNDIGRTLESSSLFMEVIRSGVSQAAVADPVDRVQRQFSVRRIGELPLSVSVGLASEDFAAWQGWLTTLLLAGGVLFLMSLALITTLQVELFRREAVEHADRRKSKFLADTSHELRTPLHSILGIADRLRDSGGLGVAQNSQVTAIIGAGEQLRRVVDRTLDYLRIENRTPTPRMSSVDVMRLVDECRGIIEPSATARGLAIEIVAKPNAPERFVTDDTFFRQILLNLLTNAVKYTTAGKIAIEIAGSAEQLSIEVQDTGCGIPAEQRHKLFADFERLGAESTDVDGYGLGLSIAHRLVDSLGGHIGERPNIGGGSVFWFSLPAGTLAERAAEAIADVPSAGRSLRILLVDDEPTNREIAEQYLRSAGHQVSETSDGQTAVRLAGERDFDVILMDWRMPGMNGLEATKRIRAIEGLRGQVPIVAVSADALDEHIQQSRRAGMCEHLAKPFSRDALLRVVAQAALQNQSAVRQSEPVAFDPDTLARLMRFLPPGAIDRQLALLACRLEALRRILEGPEICAECDLLADMAHDLAGTAGTYGFSALSAAAKRFETMISADPAQAQAAVDDVLPIVRAALAELRQLTNTNPVDADEIAD